MYVDTKVTSSQTSDGWYGTDGGQGPYFIYRYSTVPVQLEGGLCRRRNFLFSLWFAHTPFNNPNNPLIKKNHTPLTVETIQTGTSQKPQFALMWGFVRMRIWSSYFVFF